MASNEEMVAIDWLVLISVVEYLLPCRYNWLSDINGRQLLGDRDTIVEATATLSQFPLAYKIIIKTKDSRTNRWLVVSGGGSPKKCVLNLLTI